jgi:hypothetical protein
MLSCHFKYHLSPRAQCFIHAPSEPIDLLLAGLERDKVPLPFSLSVSQYTVRHAV